MDQKMVVHLTWGTGGGKVARGGGEERRGGERNGGGGKRNVGGGERDSGGGERSRGGGESIGGARTGGTAGGNGVPWGGLQSSTQQALSIQILKPQKMHFGMIDTLRSSHVMQLRVP